jgi:indolepyruvate decarboxylase
MPAISSYLVGRLEDLGLRHVFGVPGDYVMPFMDYLLDSSIQLVCTCNELNGGYAADGYARIHGLGALVVTYDVGGFSAYNAIAGAYAEGVPVVLICGGPETAQIRENLPMHHLAAGYAHQIDVYRHVTADAVILDDPATAPERIDRALARCVQRKLPVYIEIPMDMVAAECAAAVEPLTVPPSGSDPESLRQCVEESAALLAGASRPAVLVGAGARRHSVEAALLELIERQGYPAAVSIDGVSLVPTEHPAYAGIYLGAHTAPQTRDLVEGADRLLCVGTTKTDITSANFSGRIEPDRIIRAGGDFVTVGPHRYDRVSMADFLPALLAALPRRASAPPPGPARPSPAPFVAEPSRRITSDRFFARIQSFLRPHDTVVSDTGDAMFQSSALRGLERYIAQLYYLSIGYGTPAGMGAALAQREGRTIVFTGDGAFQMTAQELSTIFRYNVPVIVFLLNNDGYVIERVLHGERPYNDINRWRYAELPAVFGGRPGARVETEGELENVLASLEGPAFVEIFLERNDCGAALRAVQPAVGVHGR